MIYILAGALVIDLFLGEFPGKWHPVVWMGSYIKFLWRKRSSNSTGKLFLWGVFIVLSGVSLFSVVSSGLLYILPAVAEIVFSVLMLTSVFSIKALIKAGLDVRKALADDDLEKARELTAWHLVSRDMSSMNDEEVVSAVIESLAENITDSFTSPLLYFSIGGIPAAWAYRFINTSDSLIAYRKEDFEWGGKFTAWMDSLLNWIPSRLTGFIICISSFIIGADWKNSFRVMIAQHGKTSSPNAGWTMAAMAGALNIRLEKKDEYTLEGGNDKRVYQLIDSALKIVITSMIIILLILFLVLEVLN